MDDETRRDVWVGVLVDVLHRVERAFGGPLAGAIPGLLTDLTTETHEAMDAAVTSEERDQQYERHRALSSVRHAMEG